MRLQSFLSPTSEMPNFLATCTIESDQTLSKISDRFIRASHKEAQMQTSLHALFFQSHATAITRVVTLSYSDKLTLAAEKLWITRWITDFISVDNRDSGGFDMLQNYQAEITAFDAALPELRRAHDGAFVVIHGAHVVDEIFASYDEALGWGYKTYGLAHFFVKQVCDPSRAVHFMRSVV